jgi:hypothetical protein
MYTPCRFAVVSGRYLESGNSQGPLQETLRRREGKMTYAYRHAEFISAPHRTGGRFA